MPTLGWAVMAVMTTAKPGRGDPRPAADATKLPCIPTTAKETEATCSPQRQMIPLFGRQTLAGSVLVYPVTSSEIPCSLHLGIPHRNVKVLPGPSYRHKEWRIEYTAQDIRPKRGSNLQQRQSPKHLPDPSHCQDEIQVPSRSKSRDTLLVCFLFL